jgi:hypothetical protein
LKALEPLFSVSACQKVLSITFRAVEPSVAFAVFVFLQDVPIFLFVSRSQLLVFLFVYELKCLKAGNSHVHPHLADVTADCLNLGRDELKFMVLGRDSWPQREDIAMTDEVKDVKVDATATAATPVVPDKAAKKQHKNKKSCGCGDATKAN